MKNKTYEDAVKIVKKTLKDIQEHMEYYEKITHKDHDCILDAKNELIESEHYNNLLIREDILERLLVALKNEK